MADGLNRVLLLGNLGSDPELRYTQGGQAVLNMRLATTESYLDRNKVRQERTDWHSVVMWGKRGEALAKFLSKGSRIFVEGGLRTSSYEDKDKNKRYKTEVHATNIIFADSRGSRGSGDYGESAGGERGGGRRAASAPASAPPESAPPAADDIPPDDFQGGDDIPF